MFNAVIFNKLSLSLANSCLRHDTKSANKDTSTASHNIHPEITQKQLVASEKPEKTHLSLFRNPNSGTTKLPLALDTVNVDTLPTWPPHSSNKQEYLDMRSLSQMVVGTKLREKYCEFLLNPEDVSAEAKTNTGATSSHTEHLLFLGVALLYYNF
jgi:hypothetical protein